MVIKNIYAKNTFETEDINLDLKENQIVLIEEERDFFCVKEFFYLLRALFDDSCYVESMGGNGSIGYVCEKFDTYVSVELCRNSGDYTKEVSGVSLVGYRENIDTKLAYGHNVSHEEMLKLHDDFRDAVIPKDLREYCFYEYDILNCKMECLYDSLKEKVENPSYNPKQEEENFKIYKKMLNQSTKIFLSEGIYMSFDQEGKKVYKNYKGEIEDSIDSRDETFAEFLDLYYANKIIQEILKNLEVDYKYPIFFRGLLSHMRDEQVPLAIEMVKDLQTQVFLCEEFDFEDYKKDFDIYKKL